MCSTRRDSCACPVTAGGARCGRTGRSREDGTRPGGARGAAPSPPPAWQTRGGGPGGAAQSGADDSFQEPRPRPLANAGQAVTPSWLRTGNLAECPWRPPEGDSPTGSPGRGRGQDPRPWPRPPHLQPGGACSRAEGALHPPVTSRRPPGTGRGEQPRPSCPGGTPGTPSAGGGRRQVRSSPGPVGFGAGEVGQPGGRGQARQPLPDPLASPGSRPGASEPRPQRKRTLPPPLPRGLAQQRSSPKAHVTRPSHVLLLTSSTAISQAAHPSPVQNTLPPPVSGPFRSLLLLQEALRP